MKAISLWQPWASAIALGLKNYETRGWRPPAALIGQPLAIHAAKKKDMDCAARWMQHRLGLTPNDDPPPIEDAEARERATAALRDYDRLPFGAIVCLVRIVAVYRTEEADRAAPFMTREEKTWGDYTPGRFCWRLQLIYKFDAPIIYTGRQGFFDFEIPAAWVKEEAEKAGEPGLYEIWKAVKGNT